MASLQYQKTNSIAKKLLRALVGKLGFQISRKTDPLRLSVYEDCFAKDTLAKKPFVNVGAGDFWHPYWRNLDFVSDFYGDVQRGVIHHDLMALGPLPFESNSIKVFYTSHTIEHVKEDAVQNLFNEMYRVLEKDGIVRVVTGPDAETDFRALQNNDEDWFYWDHWYSKPGTYEDQYRCPASSVSLAERWLNHVASPLAKHNLAPSDVKLGEQEILDAIKQHGWPKCLDYFGSLCKFDPQRPGLHISWWTHEKISQYLKNAGFKTIYRSGFGQSQSPLMRQSPLFDSVHPQMSIYVEAVKD